MGYLVGFAAFIGVAILAGVFFANIFLGIIACGFPFLGSLKKEEKPETPMFTPSTGVVIKAIFPPDHGQIKYSGSFWRAVAEEPILENTVVQIVERKGLIIHVLPLDADKKESME
ncbi:MAG: NfeD family protein [Candidatus Electrothrix sp. GW3-4]|uniref:NfeD family protein n=1 Tax=Candidatus Electrothrix sp. GW3-4 TaxID=3126740 RepID=UPI0030D5C8D0